MVRYSGIQLDTQLNTVHQIRTDIIQLDTTVWDTAGYSGSAAKWLVDVDRYRYRDTQRDTKDTVRYRRAGYRLNTGGTSQKYTPGEGFFKSLSIFCVSIICTSKSQLDICCMLFLQCHRYLLLSFSFSLMYL